MASPFAFHGLGFHPNMAFTEGLAVALAPSEEDISLHRGAATLLKEQKIDPLNLFSPLFWSESGGRAYTVAGSLIKYLMDHYGLEKVKELYSGATWQETFGQETSPILKEWMAFLKKNYTDDKADFAAEQLYRYPGLLGDLCPHSKADLSNTSKSVYIALRQPRGWDENKDYWPWRVALDHSAGARLQLLRWEYFHEGPSDGLLTRIQGEFPGPIKAMEDVEARSLTFDTLMGLGRNQEARALIAQLLKDLESYSIGDANLRQLWSRKMLVDLPGDEAKIWLQLLAGKNAVAPQGDLAKQPWLLDYLFLRNHKFTEDDSELLDQLTLREVPKDIPATFAVEWWKFLGSRRFELKDYEAAAQSLQNAAELAPEGSRDALLLAADEAHFILKLAKAKAHNARH